LSSCANKVQFAGGPNQGNGVLNNPGGPTVPTDPSVPTGPIVPVDPAIL